MYQDLTGQSRIRPSRAWRLGVIGLAVALFASSIGVVAGGAGPASAQATTKTRGVTATTIRVGGLRSLPNYAGSEIGAQVVFDKVNEAGGIAGRTFEYVATVDDQNNNDGNVAAAKKLVEDEKVFAVVPVISNFFAGASVLRKARVPYFGWGFHDAFCGHKEAFGFGGCGVAKANDAGNPVWPGLVKKAHPKVKTMGFLVEDSDAAVGGTKAYLRALGGLGLKKSFTEYGIPATTPDVSAYVQKTVAANPDAVLVVAATGLAIQLIQGLKRAGYKGAISSPAIYDPRIVGIASVKDALQDVDAYVAFAAFESNNPGIKQLKADVAKYAPPNTAITQPLVSGYLSALMLTEIVAKVGKDLTYKNFYKATKGFSFDGNGAVGKVTFPHGQNNISLCGTLVTVKKDGFKESVALRCFKLPAVKKKTKK